MQLIKTTYDASKKFKSKRKIFVYHKADDKHFQVHRYFLLNPAFDFNKNLELLQSKFNDLNIKGSFQYFTNNEKYPTKIEILAQTHKQLTLF